MLHACFSFTAMCGFQSICPIINLCTSLRVHNNDSNRSEDKKGKKKTEKRGKTMIAW